MVDTIPHIDVCVCTFRRPDGLRRLLEKLVDQRTLGLFTYSVLVADNDSAESGKGVATSFAPIGGHAVKYFVEPEQNIASARNKAVTNAKGQLIAFIDDDEYPENDWLFQLFQTLEAHNVDGVLGPVRPAFEFEPPDWAIKGQFFERPSHPTGFLLDWSQTRTGNVLFLRSILPADVPPFRVEMGSAGSDMDFFRRMIDQGSKFIWCNEAIVHEVVPRSRCRRWYLLRRALLRGSNFHKHGADLVSSAAKSIIAVPCYVLILPFAGLCGQHFFLKYLIKLSDHGARLLGFCGLHVVTRRET